ncbi:DNA cytosine methyltransferase [Bathymodiolus japonicus methanotrophic gill symbiont]|uniref:DNA cytosine methyltransferase n=1 Tax=Bathymodiolus japonicus methanotrophic gill symbiont TaxID=113269 RepID=UPI001C8D09E8|nr:DNA cytosine methyltransferase [Bathymodiolus japonicus methanotrophic gill symbiont]
MTLKALSLFAGAGGMDVGVTNAGFNVILASEMDPHACNTYRGNHPNTIMIEGDINNNINEITQLKGIDIVIGGPPCQGFSVAGKMDASDPRSKLVFSYCEVVEKINPKAFIMENVKALGSLTKFEKVRQEIFKRMEAAGYQVTMNILNAKDFGVPQSRERVFFIGVKKDFKPITSKNFEQFKKEAITLRKAIAHLGRAGSKNNPNITNAKITLAKKPILRKSPYAGMLFNGQGRPLNPDAWSSTLPASMGGNRTPIIDENQLYDNQTSWVEGYHRKIMISQATNEYKEAPSRLRRLTIDEAAILQTFPTTYKFSGSQSKIFSQIGNAVPCKLAEVVARTVKQSLLK